MISKELLDLVKSRFYEVVEEEATKGDKEEYTAYMNKMLKKYKVSSPDELDEATKKKFFEEVDKGWKSDAEETGVEESINLITDKVYLAMVEEAQSGGKEEYDAFMKKMLDKYGVSSPKELDGDKKKKFFDEVDKEWESDDEKAGVEEGKVGRYVKNIGTNMTAGAITGGLVGAGIAQQTNKSMKKGGVAGAVIGGIAGAKLGHSLQKSQEDTTARYKTRIKETQDSIKSAEEQYKESKDKYWKKVIENKKELLTKLEGSLVAHKKQNWNEEGIDGNFTRDPGTVVNQDWKAPLSKNGSKNIKVFGSQGFKLLISQLDKEKINYAVSTDDSTTVQVSLKDLPRVQKLAKYTGSKFAIED